MPCPTGIRATYKQGGISKQRIFSDFSPELEAPVLGSRRGINKFPVPEPLETLISLPDARLWRPVAGANKRVAAPTQTGSIEGHPFRKPYPLEHKKSATLRGMAREGAASIGKRGTRRRHGLSQPRTIVSVRRRPSPAIFSSE